MCEDAHKRNQKRKRNQMKDRYGKRFVKGRRETVEKRDRIALGKESTRGAVVGIKEIQTVSGSVIPSWKARYVQSGLGRTTEKFYGEKAYLKGMNKRPRRKLTLGNMVTRKKRKRVEGVETVDPSRVSGQRVRQVIRVVWDIVNRERRKTYQVYRKRIQKEHPGFQNPFTSEDRKTLRKARKWYEIVRECEVYRNVYEVRARYQDHERGKRRKDRRLEAKFQTSAREPGKRMVEKKVRKGARQMEEEEREKRRAYIRSGVNQKYGEAFRRRKKRRKDYPGRKKREHLQVLVERSRESRKNPLKQKNREKRERADVGSQPDEETEILRAAPTTQYFAKVKNLIREMDRARPRKGEPETKASNRAKKRRKVPEKKRIQRYPQWTEMEKWSNRLMQKVEDENLAKILRGEEVTRSYATYRELGKKALYCYAEERSERWPRKREKEKIIEHIGKACEQP